MKYKGEDLKNLKFKHRIVIHMCIGASIVTFLALPFSLFYAFKILSNAASLMLKANLLIGLLFFYTFSLANIGYKKKGKFKHVIALVLFPAYFILHSIASYIAVFELLLRPFTWNKTAHGVSNFFEEE